MIPGWKRTGRTLADDPAFRPLPGDLDELARRLALEEAEHDRVGRAACIVASCLSGIAILIFAALVWSWW